VTLDAEWEKLSDPSGEPEAAWSAGVKEAQQMIKEETNFGQAEVIETEHPYAATRHKWSREVLMDGMNGIVVHFCSKTCTYDSRTRLTTYTGGLRRNAAGIGARVEIQVHGNDKVWGTVIARNPEDRWEVELDREPHAKEEAEDGSAWPSVGIELEAKYKTGKWHKAKVLEVRDEGIYFLEWFDGLQLDREKDITQLRPLGAQADHRNLEDLPRYSLVPDSAATICTAVCLDAPASVKVTYTPTACADEQGFGSVIGDEIAKFGLNRACPLMPFTIEAYASPGPAQQQGVKVGWYLDLVATFAGPSSVKIMDVLKGIGDIGKEEETPVAIITTFTVLLEKKSVDEKLGLSVDSSWGKFLLVDTAPEGMIASYNAGADPEKQIKEGDHIVAVNDVREDVEAMTNAIKESLKLSLTVERPNAQAFQGEWTKAAISGTTLTWKTHGKTVSLKIIDHKRFSMRWHGRDYVATLHEDGMLHWDDGDLWARQGHDANIRSIVDAAFQNAEEAAQRLNNELRRLSDVTLVFTNSASPSKLNLLPEARIKYEKGQAVNEEIQEFVANGREVRAKAFLKKGPTQAAGVRTDWHLDIDTTLRLNHGLAKELPDLLPPEPTDEELAAVAAARAAADAAEAERIKERPCPDCATPMVWSDFAEGPYAFGWICNGCRGGKATLGASRWFCSSCSNDFCETCVKKVRRPVFCASGHKMKKDTAAPISWTCSSCSLSDDAKGRWRCESSCDFNLCKGCFEFELGDTVVEETVAAPPLIVEPAFDIHDVRIETISDLPRMEELVSSTMEAKMEELARAFGASSPDELPMLMPFFVPDISVVTAAGEPVDGPWVLETLAADAYPVIFKIKLPKPPKKEGVDDVTASEENDEGAPSTWNKASKKFYCARFLGEDAIPDSDGRCGPDNGPQCESCKRLQERMAWRVITSSSAHNLRKEKSKSSEMVGQVLPGELIYGTREGDWLRLMDVSGYCLICEGSEIFLKKMIEAEGTLSEKEAAAKEAADRAAAEKVAAEKKAAEKLAKGLAGLLQKDGVTLAFVQPNPKKAQLYQDSGHASPDNWQSHEIPGDFAEFEFSTDGDGTAANAAQRWGVLAVVLPVEANRSREEADAFALKSAEATRRAVGIATTAPEIERNGWDEARLRALCARHGWEFEWMTEDGERRRRAREKWDTVKIAEVAFRPVPSDTAMPDGQVDEQAAATTGLDLPPVDGPREPQLFRSSSAAKV